MAGGAGAFGGDGEGQALRTQAASTLGEKPTAIA
jgi:hypothetical protein